MCFGPHCTLQSLCHIQKVMKYTQNMKYYSISTCTKTERKKSYEKREVLMICKTQMVSHRWGYRRISRLRQPVQTQLIPTGRTPSPRRGISLSVSLHHWLTILTSCCFDITFHHACVSITHSSPNTTPENI